MQKEIVYETMVEEEERENSIKEISRRVIKWTGKNLKFLFAPASRLEDLTLREFEYEMNRSKRKFIRRFKSTLTILGIVLVFFISTLAVFPHWISPYTFQEVAVNIYSGSWGAPSPAHPFGQTKFGRDVLARVIFGARTSLTVALPAIGLSVIAGVVIGIIAAYYGGWIDAVIMRIIDVFMAFPALILALVLSLFLERLLVLDPELII